MKLLPYALAAGLAAASASAPAVAADITGAGATFPFPVYSKWAEAYRKEAGIGLNYQSIGSGGGIRQIKAKTVDFGATDAPLKGDDLDKSGLVQFPTVLGGVVPVMNISGLKSGELKLTGDILADIYRGQIKKWNDPRIAQINQGVTLPDANITPVYRSDGSGTTSIFTDLPLERLARVEVVARHGHDGELAGRPGRQGQRGRRRDRQAGRERDRLCRVRLRQAEQHAGRAGAEQGRAVRRAGRQDLRGRGRERGLERGSGLRHLARQPAGRASLADHRRDLHPGLQDPGQARAGGRGAEVLRLGLQERRQARERPRLRAAAG